jgi:hypothetical protein
MRALTRRSSMAAAVWSVLTQIATPRNASSPARVRVSPSQRRIYTAHILPAALSSFARIQFINDRLAAVRTEPAQSGNDQPGVARMVEHNF